MGKYRAGYGERINVSFHTFLNDYCVDDLVRNHKFMMKSLEYMDELKIMINEYLLDLYNHSQIVINSPKTTHIIAKKSKSYADKRINYSIEVYEIPIIDGVANYKANCKYPVLEEYSFNGREKNRFFKQIKLLEKKYPKASWDTKY